MMSPTLMSLQLPSLIPHSKPSRTSTTSSLNRRSESIGRLSVDHHAVAQQPGPGVAADLPGLHDAAGDGAEPGGPEDLADLGPTQLDLLELRLEHALERLPRSRRWPGRSPCSSGSPRPRGRPARWPCPRPRTLKPSTMTLSAMAQVDVALGDATDAAVDDPQLDVVAHVELHQRVLERLDGARVVALDDQGELLGLLRARRPGPPARPACGGWPARRCARGPAAARRSAGPPGPRRRP